MTFGMCGTDVGNLEWVCR